MSPQAFEAALVHAQAQCQAAVVQQTRIPTPLSLGSEGTLKETFSSRQSSNPARLWLGLKGYVSERQIICSLVRSAALGSLYRYGSRHWARPEANPYHQSYANMNFSLAGSFDSYHRPTDGMELSQRAIHDVIHPTAAFSTNRAAVDSVAGDLPWEESCLNPKNRIDSLEPLYNPMWRIDGCTAFGTQLYAVPLFMGAMPPWRVDVYLPDPSTLPADLREVLDMDVMFYTRDAFRISHLGITRHILRILQHWCLLLDDYHYIYHKVPFGTRIVLHNLPKNVDDALITVAPTHHLERQLLSESTLLSFWPPDLTLTPTVDINNVVHVSQTHDSVCLVRIDGKEFIFKAITSYTKYLYHELLQLLTIPPHDNIITKPVHLVTKICRFGNKTAVVGFTLQYHIHGSLRDLIPFLELHGLISLADKTRWSQQLTSALLHLREKANTFYPDLRLDNIVLSGKWDAIMVDFEQRGVWCEFAAPEVNAIEYIRLVAIDDDIEPSVRDKYAAILSDLLPGWRDMEDADEYEWPNRGYNIAWSCLTPAEQEACEVYMLGRVLWCIFEACSAPQRAAVWLSYRWEPPVDFPAYTKTPSLIRDLIDVCTRGRRVPLSQHIVRKRDTLVLRDFEDTDQSSAEQVKRTASDWWKVELVVSEKWLQGRKDGMTNGSWNENYYNRPRLNDVLKVLQGFAETL